MNNLVGDVKANPRDFYWYINSQKKDTQGIPPLKRKNGKGVAQSDLEKAEEFNGQSTDVFNKNDRVSRSLKKGQGGIQKKGTWCALSHWKRAHSVCARAMRKRQKGYFQCNVEKH